MQQYTKAFGGSGLSRHLKPRWRGKACTPSTITRLQGCGGCARCLPAARPRVQGSSRIIQRTGATAAGQPDSRGDKAVEGATTAAALSSELALGLQQPAVTDLETVASADSALEVVQASSSNICQAIQSTAQCLLQVMATMVQSAALVEEGKVSQQFTHCNARGWDVVLRLPLHLLAKSSQYTPAIKLQAAQSPAVSLLCAWLAKRLGATSTALATDTHMMYSSSAGWNEAEQDLAVANVTPLGWSDTPTSSSATSSSSSNDSSVVSSSTVHVLLAFLNSNQQPVRVITPAEADPQELPTMMTNLMTAVTQLSSYIPFPLYDNPTQLAPVRDLLARTAQQPAMSASSRALQQSLQAYLDQEASRTARWQDLTDQQQQELQKQFYQQQQGRDSAASSAAGGSSGSSSHTDEDSNTDMTPSNSASADTLATTAAEAAQHQQYRMATAELLLQLLLLVQQLISALGLKQLRCELSSGGAIKLRSMLRSLGVDMAVSAAALALLMRLPELPVVYIFCPDQRASAMPRRWLGTIPVAAMSYRQVGKSSVIFGSTPVVERLAAELTAERTQQQWQERWHQQLGFTDSSAGAAVVVSSRDAQLLDWVSVPFNIKLGKRQPQVIAEATRDVASLGQRLLATLVEWDAAVGPQQVLLNAAACEHLAQYLNRHRSSLAQDVEPLGLIVRQMVQQLCASTSTKLRNGASYHLLQLGNTPAYFGSRSISSSRMSSNSSNISDESPVAQPDNEQGPESADQSDSKQQLQPDDLLLPKDELLSLLSSSPAARISGWDDLEDLLPDGHDLVRGMLQATQNCSLDSGEFQLSEVHSWLLPQLLAEDRPPLLVAAAAAEQACDAVAAVLMAAADGIAPIAEGEEDDDVDDEARDDPADDAEVLGSEDSDPMDSGSGSGVIVAQGGWSMSSGTSAVAADLPWELEHDQEQQNQEIAAATAADDAAVTVAEPLLREPDGEPEGFLIRLLGEVRETDALHWHQQQDEQQQQQEELQQPHQQRINAVSDPTVGEANSGIAPSDDIDQAAAQPHLLLLCPTAAAAAAAAKQHNGVLAAAGVTATVLPSDLVAQLTEAASALKQQSFLREKLTAAKVDEQLQQVTDQIGEALQQQEDSLSEHGWLPKLQHQWQQTLDSHAAVITADQMDDLLQQVVDLGPDNFADSPQLMQNLLDVLSIHLKQQQQSIAIGGTEYCWWTTIVRDATERCNFHSDQAVPVASVLHEMIAASAARFAEFNSITQHVQQRLQQLQQQGSESAAQDELQNPVLVELGEKMGDTFEALQLLQKDWQELQELHSAAGAADPLLDMQQQVIETVANWEVSPLAIDNVFTVMGVYLRYRQQQQQQQQADPETGQTVPLTWADLLKGASGINGKPDFARLRAQTGEILQLQNTSMIWRQEDIDEEQRVRLRRQQQLQEQQQRLEQQGEQQMQNPVLEEASGHCSEVELQELHSTWRWLVADYAAVEQTEGLLAMQQQLIEALHDWVPTAKHISCVFGALSRYLNTQRALALLEPAAETQMLLTPFEDLLKQALNGHTKVLALQLPLNVSSVVLKVLRQAELLQEHEKRKARLGVQQQQQAQNGAAGAQSMSTAAGDSAAKNMTASEDALIETAPSTELQTDNDAEAAGKETPLPVGAASTTAAASVAAPAQQQQTTPTDSALITRLYGPAAYAEWLQDLQQQEQQLQQALEELKQQQAAADTAVQQARGPVSDLLNQISDVIWGTDLLFASAADVSAVMTCQRSADDSSVLDLLWVRWCVLMPDQQSPAAAAAEPASEASEAPADRSNSVDSGTFWADAQEVCSQLQLPEISNTGALLSQWEPVNMTRAARLVVVTQDLSPTLFERLNDLARQVGQERPMVKLAFMPPPPLTAAAAAAADRGGAGMQCRLLPPVWPTVRQLQQLTHSLVDAVQTAESLRNLRSQKYQQAIHQIWVCIELYRMLDLHGTRCQPRLPKEQRKQLHWALKVGQRRQQQHERKLVVVLQQLDKDSKQKARKAYEEAAQGYLQLVTKAASTGYPPLYVREYNYRERKLTWRQSVVITHDSAEQPAYRSDLDPNTPDDLEFRFPDTARQLLDQELPTLQLQQQQLQQAAEAKGIHITPVAAAAASSSKVDAGPGQGHRKKRSRRPGMSLTAYRELSRHLKELKLSNEGDPAFEALQSQRSELPAAAARAECLALMQQHQVLVVTGETGCGKSTQVPQFILEDAIAAGTIARTNIVVSQPRRLITTSLSSRVATERGESVGDVTGYSIHADKKISSITRLTFCTTGILIRRLMIDPQLSNVSHVIIDEVHERGLEVDFLLTAMRQLAASRPDLKLILMSATVSPQGLMDYFQGALQGSVGSYHISGYTYDVDEFYLEDLIEARLRTALAAEALVEAEAGVEIPLNNSPSGSASSSQSNYALRSKAQAAAAAANEVQNLPLAARVVVDRIRGAKPLNFYQEKEFLGYQVEKSDLAGYSPATVTELRHWAQAITSPWPSFSKDQHAATAIAAIQFIVEHEPDPGAVLVFLPSLGSIMDVFQSLLENHPLLSSRLKLFVLHSIIPMSEQQDVFQPVEPGLRKVILATNIAESSITFDDVVVIIDSCRVNVAGFDPVNNMPRLGPKWASQASLLQRRGRAGRVRRGMALHLIPRKMADHHLELYDSPEIQQVPLADTCLLVKSLGFSDIGAFLAATPSPPDSRAVQTAVSELQQLSALGGDQQLTPLGRLLALLPGDVKVTRMVIFGALLGVLDPVLTIAAAESSSHDLMRMPNEAMIQQLNESEGSSASTGGSWIEQARSIVEDQRQKIAPGVTSDHEVTLAIYKEYESILQTPNRYGVGKAPDFIIKRKLWESLLSERTLSSVRKERLQYTQLLYRAGFLRFKEGPESNRPLPWYSTGGTSNFEFDQLFDQEVDQLLGIDQDQPDQQQQQRTAMDWMLGEYADAAAGPDELSSLADTDSSSSSNSRTRSALGTTWLDEDYPSNSSRGPGTKAAASDTASAAGMNDVLPSGDLSSYKLRQLIKQYSWNADQQELLQAVLAAGLYPNFAFVEPPDSWRRAANKGVVKGSLSKRLQDRRAGHRLRYTDPLNGAVKPHLRAAMSQLLPHHRWVVFSSKRLNTELAKTNLLGVTAVPDLAALLFDADMQHNLPSRFDANSLSSDPVAETPSESSEGMSVTDVARVQAELFQGYAKYALPIRDAAALVQLRDHLQLLLQMKVAGLSAEVFNASQGFSSLLLQLLRETGGSGDPVLAWLRQTQQRLLAEKQAEEERKAAAEHAVVAQGDSKL